MDVKGTLWENGSGSVGLDNSMERKYKQTQKESAIYDSAYRLDNRLSDHYVETDCGSEYVGSYTSKEAFENGILSRDGYAKLGLSNATILRQKPQKRLRKGLNGLSTRGKLMVLNASLRLTREITRPCIGFLTVTLPQLPSQIMALVTAADWGRLEKSLYAMLHRFLKKAHMDHVGFIGVTEIQSSRYRDTGEAYPHWHFILPIKKNPRKAGGTPDNPWVVPLTSAWSRFEKILWSWVHYMIEKYNLPPTLTQREMREKAKTCKATFDLKPVKKDASTYISKYMSKGSCIAKMQEDGKEAQVPYQWWYVSQTLKSRVVQKIVKISGFTGRFIWYHLDELVSQNMVDWFAALYLSQRSSIDDRDEDPVQIGISFHCTREGAQLIQDLLFEQEENELVFRASEFLDSLRQEKITSWIDLSFLNPIC